MLHLNKFILYGYQCMYLVETMQCFEAFYPLLYVVWGVGCMNGCFGAIAHVLAQW